MSNRVTQKIHEGQQAFVDNPFGGAMMMLVTGGGLGGGGAIAGRALSGLKAMRPLAMRGGSAALNFGKRYVSSISMKSIIINTSLSVGSQLITKQNFGKVDFFDAAMAGLGGRAWGQVIGGVTGGLFDYTLNEGRIGPSSKSGYKLGVDLSTGAASGIMGAVINLPMLGISPAWQNGGGFLNQMIGDGFNTVLNPDYD